MLRGHWLWSEPQSQGGEQGGGGQTPGRAQHMPQHHVWFSCAFSFFLPPITATAPVLLFWEGVWYIGVSWEIFFMDTGQVIASDLSSSCFQANLRWWWLKLFFLMVFFLKVEILLWLCHWARGRPVEPVPVCHHTEMFLFNREGPGAHRALRRFFYQSHRGGFVAAAQLLPCPGEARHQWRLTVAHRISLESRKENHSFQTRHFFKFESMFSHCNFPHPLLVWCQMFRSHFLICGKHCIKLRVLNSAGLQIAFKRSHLFALLKAWMCC